MMMTAMLIAMPLLAANQARDAIAEPTETAACRDVPRLAATPRFKPQARPLTAEPPARHIATVYATQQGCPVMLVLDEGSRKWRAAPDAAARPTR